MVYLKKRFLKSDAYQKARANGKLIVTEYGTAGSADPGKGLMSKLVSSLIPGNNFLGLTSLSTDLGLFSMDVQETYEGDHCVILDGFPDKTRKFSVNWSDHGFPSILLHITQSVAPYSHRNLTSYSKSMPFPWSLQLTENLRVLSGKPSRMTQWSPSYVSWTSMEKSPKSAEKLTNFATLSSKNTITYYSVICSLLA